jgi:hypothetical protein
MLAHCRLEPGGDDTLVPLAAADRPLVLGRRLAWLLAAEARRLGYEAIWLGVLPGLAARAWFAGAVRPRDGGRGAGIQPGQRRGMSGSRFRAA